MFAAKASRLTSQVQKVVQQSTRNSSVVSGPPTVKVSPAEKLIHGLVMVVGFAAVPAYVLVNIKKYRGVVD